MAYIGKTPTVGNFQKCDAISVVNGQAGYTLQVDSVNVSPESANHCLVSLNGILQAPTDSYTISGSTITFASNLATGDVIDFVIILGNVLDLGVPSDATVTNAKTNFVSTSSAAGLQIKGDNTTAGTLQLNCEQNSHGIKLRSPAHSAGQSYTLTFPTTAPSSGKALVTDGSGNLSFSSAGGLVYLHQASSSSDVSSITIDSTYINSTYDSYIIEGNFYPATDNVYLRGRLQSSGSDLTGTDYSYGIFRFDAAYDYGQSNGADVLPIHGTGSQGNASNEFLYVRLILNNVNSTTYHTYGIWDTIHRETDGSFRHEKANFAYNTPSTVMNGFSFFYSSGNISQYEYKIWGIKDS